MSPDLQALAREVGLLPDGSHPAPDTLHWRRKREALARFAVLVAAVEREACAQVAATTCSPAATAFGNGYNQAALDVERAIRARGTP